MSQRPRVYRALHQHQQPPTAQPSIPPSDNISSSSFPHQGSSQLARPHCSVSQGVAAGTHHTDQTKAATETRTLTSTCLNPIRAQWFDAVTRPTDRRVRSTRASATLLDVRNCCNLLCKRVAADPYYSLLSLSVLRPADPLANSEETTRIAAPRVLKIRWGVGQAWLRLEKTIECLEVWIAMGKADCTARR